MSDRNRLAGHNLADEGAAFEMVQGRAVRVRPNSVAGTGFAICGCGVHSPILDSGAARRAWHRAHKDQHRSTTQP